jgi:hypothetical protein
VAEVLRALKRKDYRRSSHVLQNTEARLCVGRVCGRIMRERSDLPVVTIHDGYLVRARDVGHVKDVIVDEFKQAGVDVTVREKGRR